MPSDADQIRDLEEELDALDDPTTAEVLFHTRDYDAGIVAAIGVQRGTSGAPAGSGYVAGTDRITVSISGLVIPHGAGPTAIDWSTGTPFIFSRGTALATDGADIVFLEDGLYDVKVHVPRGVTDGDPDTPVTVRARLALTAGVSMADGDDDTHEAGATIDGAVDAALSAHWTWVQEAGATLNCTLAVDGTTDGHVISCIAQIVRISDIQGGDS